MSDGTSLAERIDRLRESYAGLGGPMPDQWDQLLSIPPGHRVCLVNLFAFRTTADYGDSREHARTGREAFDEYAVVSAPALERVGGRFVHFGTHRGNLVGDDETWDLVVIGEYPDVEAVVALHEDGAYRDAYRHRVAACSAQRVVVSA